MRSTVLSNMDWEEEVVDSATRGASPSYHGGEANYKSWFIRFAQHRPDILSPEEAESFPMTVLKDLFPEVVALGPNPARAIEFLSRMSKLSFRENPMADSQKLAWDLATELAEEYSDLEKGYLASQSPIWNTHYDEVFTGAFHRTIKHLRSFKIEDMMTSSPDGMFNLHAVSIDTVIAFISLELIEMGPESGIEFSEKEIAQINHVLLMMEAFQNRLTQYGY